MSIDGIVAIQNLLVELQHRGFKRSSVQSSAKALFMLGALKTSKGDVSCSIEIDRSFRTPPRVKVTDLSKLPTCAPHMGPQGELCYANKGSYVFDIHYPVQQTISLINRAEQVLDKLLCEEMQEDLTDEFFAYWGMDTIFFTDIEKYQTGSLKACINKRGNKSHFFLTDSIERTTKKIKILRQDIIEINVPVFLISTRKEPHPYLENWPIKTLGELINWQRTLDKNMPKKILRKIKKAYKSNKNGCLTLISSPKITYGFIVFFKEGEYREIYSEKLIFPLEILNAAASRLDDKYIIKRNTPNTQTLEGLKLVVIGCGTIGSFLSELLLKAGAGLVNGKLTLFDTDTLGTNNLGRHRLGLSYLGQPKATALEKELKLIMPTCNVSGINNDIRDYNLSEFDIIIDATGDESLGYWIAEKYHSRLPILSIWIEGQGAAIRSLLKTPNNGACYRCLCDYNKKLFFKSVQEEFGQVMTGHGCEGLYVPFPATTSVQAACLAVESIIDFFGNKKLPLIRTRVIDSNFTLGSHDCCPLQLESCPACNS
ncbi:ThiF family adenylyltransferase [Marinomonas polaris]|uniref:ThiF family adenylyltransferase n=1 Tax=Marinomonas polaris TaxID=293552 RepID=UPI003F9A7A7C